MMTLKKLTPMLNVTDIHKSLQFYQTGFGFNVVSDPEYIDEWRWATIKSGDVELMLSESEGDSGLSQGINPHENVDWPCIYYFYPDNVEVLYQHIIQQGFKPTQLETTFYGMQEFSIQDPDGHMLSFGQDSSNNELS